jgi:hypothetical protein
MIKSFCEEVYGIKRKKVLFAYGDVNKILKGLIADKGCPVYCDINTRLAVLIVSGVEPAQVQEYRDNLEQCIITVFRQFNFKNKFRLPEGTSRILEIFPSCSFIVLHLSTQLFVALLCTLGDKQSRTRFIGSLWKALPGSKGMVLRLGGLPPMELVPTDEDEYNAPVYVKLVRPYQSNQILCCALSRTEKHVRSLKLQASHCFTDIDSLTDSLGQIRKEVEEIKTRQKCRQAVVRRESKSLDQCTQIDLKPAIIGLTDDHSVAACLIRIRLKELAVTRDEIFLYEELERCCKVVESWRQSRLADKVAESVAHCQTLPEGLKCSLVNLQLLNKQSTDLPTVSRQVERRCCCL